MISEDAVGALIAAACEARQRAYAPYSNYLVGAALLVDDGRIITGVNVENALYGLGICAERSAVFTAVSSGFRQISAVAVCTKNAAAPCGACRQVLVEFAGDIPIYLCDEHGNVRRTSLQELLPDHFGRQHLDT